MQVQDSRTLDAHGRQPPGALGRIAVGMIAALSLLAVLVSPAAAQDGDDNTTGPQDQSLFVEPPTTTPGGFIDVSGTCGEDAAGSDISIGLGDELGNEIVGANIDADDEGDFRATIVLPEDASIGSGVAYAVCGLGPNLTPTAPLTIVEDFDDDPAGSTPFLAVEPNVATFGDTIDVTGSCGLARANVYISIGLSGAIGDGIVVDDVPTGPRGRFSGSFTLAGSGPSGTGNVFALCTSPGGLTPTTTLTVLEGIDGDDPGSQFVSVDPSRTEVGGVVQVAGSCGTNVAGSSISLRLAGEVEARTIATNIDTADDGDFRSSVLLPEDVDTGQAMLIAMCGPGPDDTPRTLLRIVEDDSDPDTDDPNPAVLDLGDRGPLVTLWQARLNDWLRLSGTGFVIGVDGIFGPRTEQATLRFQITETTLANNGVVDSIDRLVLNDAIDELEDDDSSGDDPTPPVIERGDRGQAVAAWQADLNVWLGLSGAELELGLDGIFGPRTEQATLRFQITEPSLANDGVVDSIDRIALDDAVEELDD